VCVDERPCQLLGEVIVPIAMKPGQSRRRDYEYQRNGVATLFVAVEPLTGTQLLTVSSRRTKVDYAAFMQEVRQQWSGAEQIRLAQDNLNTHTPGSFYAAFSAEEAFAIAGSF
jgi:hypothetical protein